MILTVSQTPSQNAFSGRRWYVKNKLREQYVDEIPPTKSNGRVAIVTVARYSTRELDYGNLVGGCKPLLDALKHRGWIVDDSPRWLADNYEQRKCVKGRERTEIEITYA